VCHGEFRINVSLMHRLCKVWNMSEFLFSSSVQCHKTFHRYVVRAKHGTSQSSRDNKGGSAPKSAGASLRRHNETALAEVVTASCNLLAELTL